MNKPYLEKTFDWRTKEVADSFDEITLWSANFGQLLLEHFPIRDYKRVLDIGFGTGFPLLELAQRLGNSCMVYGVDPWKEAGERALKKAKTFHIFNIKMFEQDATSLPFEDESFGLVTSNLGINNFENPQVVTNECYRVLEKGGHICLTSNLVGTFREFFDLFEKTLVETGLDQYLDPLRTHIGHRATAESLHKMLEQAGFQVKKRIHDKHTMRFKNGTAFLNHSFIILGFIDSWRKMIAPEHKAVFFDRFETNLNAYAKRVGELQLSVPMIYVEGVK